MHLLLLDTTLLDVSGNFWVVHASLLLVLLPLFPWFDLKTSEVLYHVRCEASKDIGCTLVLNLFMIFPTNLSPLKDHDVALFDFYSACLFSCFLCSPLYFFLSLPPNFLVTVLQTFHMS